MRKYIFLLIMLLVLTSCIFEYTENGDTDEDLEKIRQVFLNIFDEFTMFDVDGVMEYFSSDFLNDGVDFLKNGIFGMTGLMLVLQLRSCLMQVFR